MEIYPENLGPEISAAVQHERSLRQPNEPDVSSPATAGFTLLICAIAVMAVLWLFQAGAVAFVCVPFLLLLVFILKLHFITPARVQVKQRRKSARLVPAEVQALDTLQSGALLHRYLELVVEVVQTDVHDPDAQREVRTALQTLGTTAMSLPAEEPNAILDAPARLHAEAARLSAEADAEPDAVIGASLRRRAESLARRADTAAKTSLLLRRNQALRQETAEQMEALKTSLTAFRVGGQPSVPELADLAAGIQRVAREANAITEARAEVGTLLAAPGRLREDTEPIQRQSVGG